MRLRTDSSESPRSVDSISSSPVTSERDRLTMGMIIISMAREQEITKRARKYLTSFLQSTKKYKSVIVSNLMEVLEEICNAFLNSQSLPLKNLTRLKEELDHRNINTVDGLYFFHVYYLPARKSIDEKYQDLLQTLIAELGMELDISHWDIDKLIHHRTAIELKSEIWASYLRYLSSRNQESMASVMPFAEQYAKCSSEVEKLRALDTYLMSLSDYTCFIAQYEYVGRRNYLNSFASVCERSLKKRLEKPAPDRYILTNRLWEYFVSIISVDQLLSQLNKFSIPQGARLTKSEKLDPSPYFRFQTYPVRDVKQLTDKTLGDIQEDEVKSYLAFLGSYITACNNLCEAIEDIVPLLGSMKRGSKHKTVTNDLRPLPSALEKTYRRFAEIKNVTLAQKTALQCWVN